MSRISDVPLKKEMFSLFVVALIVVAALTSSFFFYDRYQKAQDLLAKGGDAQSVAEVRGVMEKVGKLIQLPSGEEPTLATVSDKSKLAGQSFFVNAQNGDKVLIYQNAKKAILYRPSAHKIIEVAPVNFPSEQQVAGVQDQQSASSEAELVSPTPMELPTVSILNGTSIVGLTRKVETALKAEVPEVEILTKENAKSQEYSETIVIDVNGSFKVQAEQIAKLLGVKVGTLPKNETKPTSDILIIAAPDFQTE